MTSSVITLEFAQNKVVEYLAAEEKILTSQEYSIGDRSLTRVALRELVKQREKWELVCSRLARGSRSPIVTQVVPRDN